MVYTFSFEDHFNKSAIEKKILCKKEQVFHSLEWLFPCSKMLSSLFNKKVPLFQMCLLLLILLEDFYSYGQWYMEETNTRHAWWDCRWGAAVRPRPACEAMSSIPWVYKFGGRGVRAALITASPLPNFWIRGKPHGLDDVALHARLHWCTVQPECRVTPWLDLACGVGLLACGD